MHTLIAFYESITNGSTYAAVNGVLDHSMSFDSSSRFLLPKPGKLLAGYAMGVNLTAARINSPSLRSMILPQIYPANDTADVPTVESFHHWYGRGAKLVAGESLELEVSRGGADAQPCIGGLWLDFGGSEPLAQGPSYTLPLTTTNTLVAGSWTLSALTPEQNLPAGVYQVIGMQVVCNDATFARLVYPGVTNWRPGVVVQDAYGDLFLGDPFRQGRFGSFGQFTTITYPSIEILGDTAGAESAVVYLDVVQISHSIPLMGQ